MKRALIGFGGHAKEVMAQMGCKLPCFVEDEYCNERLLPISSFDCTMYEVMVCFGNPIKRKEIINMLPNNTKFFTWIHPTSIVMDNVEIGEGSFIGAYSILTTNIKIGKHALLNRFCQIGHDCIIGDFFSMMPGSVVSGNVTIYDCVYLGTNSSIKEKLSIHSLSIIGLNSGVVKDIKEPGVYGGTPSKIIKL
jgi:sugar O-acyltransferase (sialic acid O-acetyltransferase NeuD family)